MMIHNLRPGTVVYPQAILGLGITTGHNVIIRNGSIVRDGCTIGTNCVIEGDCEIGKDTTLQTGVYISRNCKIGNNVFIGPCACLLNDKYPPKGPLNGVTIEDDAIIGGNATILPGVKIGHHAFVAAGAVVTVDVPPHMMAIGVPARIKKMPRGMQ